ncbi:hypothetical protein J7M07_00425, partial [bacterium]|nr:hypothetical protein [bacterium]
HLLKSGFELIHNYGMELVVVYLLFGGILINAYVRIKKLKVYLFFLILPVSVILCLTAIALFNLKVFNVRYLIVIFPLFIALLAIGIPRKVKGASIVLTCVAVLMFFSDYNYFTKGEYARDNIRGAVEIVSRNETPGDAIVLMGIYAGFEHYYRGEISDERIFQAELNSDSNIEKIKGVAGKAERVWFVKCRQWPLDSDDSVSEAFSGNMKRVKEWKLSGVRVFLFERIPK